jgi:hypothetical protein
VEESILEMDTSSWCGILKMILLSSNTVTSVSGSHLTCPPAAADHWLLLQIPSVEGRVGHVCAPYFIHFYSRGTHQPIAATYGPDLFVCVTAFRPQRSYQSK